MEHWAEASHITITEQRHFLFMSPFNIYVYKERQVGKKGAIKPFPLYVAIQHIYKETSWEKK